MPKHVLKRNAQGFVLALALCVLSIVSLFIVGLQQELQFAQRVQTQEAIRMEQEQAMLQSLYAMTQVLAENRKHSPLSVHAHEIGHFSALRYTLTRLPDAPCVMDLNQKNLRWYQLLLENKESTLRLESTIVLPSNNVSKPCKKQRIIQSSVVALAFI